jgi:hypothetical protein
MAGATDEASNSVPPAAQQQQGNHGNHQEPEDKKPEGINQQQHGNVKVNSLQGMAGKG